MAGDSVETSQLAMVGGLADAITSAATRASAQDPAVRGADWRQGIVTTVRTDGTVEVDDVLICRRLAPYTAPAVGDRIIISPSSRGDWITFGPMASGSGGWTALTLATGYGNPGHGYVAGWLREGKRITLRGRIGRTSGGTTIPNATTVATIPTALRPSSGVAVGWAVARDTNVYPATCRVEITVDGALRTYELTTPPEWIALDGISYFTS